MSDQLRFRPAVSADVLLLKHWDQQPHVVASNPNDDWDWEQDLAHDPAWRANWVAETEGKPIGVLQIIDPAEEETHYWGEVPPNLRALDIWIGEADYLNRGYGTAMMQWALAQCFAHPEVQAILIDPLVSNEGAIRFYRRQGFVPIERRRFGADDCLVMRLERDSWMERSGNMDGLAGL